MDEIEGILSEIIEKETKEPVKKEENFLLDTSDLEEVEKELIKQTLDDRKTADKIFQLFFANLGTRVDRSEGSKEALTKALELKILASKNLIDLLKLKKAVDKNQLGVFINTMSSKKAGIDVRNLQQDEVNDE